MLYIVQTVGTRKVTKERTWWVGQKVPQVNVDTVIEVQADGDELTHVKSRCSIKPLSEGPVANWYGSDARQVYRSL